MTEEKVNQSYQRKVLALMSGAVIAKILPVAVSPILTRIYGPDDFGVAAIFFASTSIISSIINGKYELAIGLPKCKDEAINLAALSVIVSIGISISLFLIILICGEKLVNNLGLNEIASWLYLIPFSVLVTGLFNVLNYTNNRLGQFNDIAKSNIYKSISSSVAQIMIGYISKGASGLIVGVLISELIANIKLISNIKKKFNFSQVSWENIKKVSVKYKDFPVYNMTGSLLNTMGNQAIIFVLPIMFGMGVLGGYSFSMRVLGTPAFLIAAAFSQVFLREATLEKQKYGNAKNSLKTTTKQLIKIGFPIFGMLYYFSDEMFAIVFGEPWRESGKYASIMAPLFFIRFVVSSVSVLPIVLEKNKVNFYWQIGLVILSLFLICFSSFFNFNVYEYLWLNTICMSMYYLFLLVILFKLDAK